MCRWTIHTWMLWIHCIICTCGWHPPPLHYHRNCIYRRPHYFPLEISNAFKNTILPNPSERVYLSLPHLFMDFYKRKCTKTSVRLKRAEGSMHSVNKINQRNKNFWKIMVWLTKINLYHCKNDQKIFWSCYIIMGIQELKIITFCWNIWHPLGNREYNLFFKTHTRIMHSIWPYLPRGTKNEHHSK